jgi:transcriptional regulator with XRE-family HTH domain
MTNETPAQRLGRLIRARRKALKLTQADVQTAGGPSTATLRLIENGKHTDFRASTSRPLEAALQWTPGSIDKILAGGRPIPVDDQAALVRRHFQIMQKPEAERTSDDLAFLQAERDARGFDAESSTGRLLRIRATPVDQRTTEDVQFIEEWEAAHPRRPDPNLGVDEDGNWLPVETTFENWVRARNQLSTRVLHYARARGISFNAAEEELPHVHQMATDVANGTGRPWTPPWDPGAEFEEDEEPWKAEFWTYTEAVPSPFGTEGHIYQHGITYDLAEARRRREDTAQADEVWEADVRRQTAAYQERQSISAADDAALTSNDAPPREWLDGRLRAAHMTNDSVVSETVIPSDADLTSNDSSQLRAHEGEELGEFLDQLEGSVSARISSFNARIDSIDSRIATSLLDHYAELRRRAAKQQRSGVLNSSARAELRNDPGPESVIEPEISDDLYVRYLAARLSNWYGTDEPGAVGLDESEYKAALRRFRREFAEMVVFNGRIRTAGAPRLSEFAVAAAREEDDPKEDPAE